MPSSLGSEMSDFIKRIAEIRINEGAEGFNLLMRNGKAAGQDVFHAHIHLIPRKSGDGISSLSV
jgi:histidine triad (HIT) family protein